MALALALPQFDLCWLDCPNLGDLYLYRGEPNLVVCLCRNHRRILEEGQVAGQLEGAPLPPESKSTEWPWQLAGTIL